MMNPAFDSDAMFIREDQKVAVSGFWRHRGGCLYAGEIAVFWNGKTMRFSSTSPFTSEQLAGYATPAYLERHASKFH